MTKRERLSKLENSFVAFFGQAAKLFERKGQALSSITISDFSERKPIADSLLKQGYLKLAPRYLQPEFGAAYKPTVVLVSLWRNLGYIKAVA